MGPTLYVDHNTRATTWLRPRIRAPKVQAAIPQLLRELKVKISIGMKQDEMIKALSIHGTSVVETAQTLVAMTQPINSQQ